MKHRHKSKPPEKYRNFILNPPKLKKEHWYENSLSSLVEKEGVEDIQSIYPAQG